MTETVSLGAIPALVLRHFVASIEATDRNLADAEVFQSALFVAVTNCGFELSDLAALLGTSKATISRWKSGESAPYPQYRASIILSIKDEALRRIDLLESNGDSEIAESKRHKSVANAN